MGVEFAGVPCLDPVELHRSCLAQDPPIPVEHFWGKANSFHYSLGVEPGEGWLLVMRSDLKTDGYPVPEGGTAPPNPGPFTAGTIRLDQGQDLQFGDGANTTTLKNLWVVDMLEVTPGYELDGNAACLIKVVDRRWKLWKIPVDIAYNVEMETSAPSGASASGSGSGGGGSSAMSWQAIIEDLWSQAGLPLPINWPSTVQNQATPNYVEFWNTPVAAALQYSLFKVGCVMKYDPTTDTFGVVRMGDMDPTAEAILAGWKSQLWKVWDEYPNRSQFNNSAGTLRVYFPFDPPPPWDDSPYYSVDETDPNPQYEIDPAQVDTLVEPMAALADEPDTDPTNLTVLETRAAQIATDYYDRKRNFESEMVQTFGRTDSQSVSGNILGPRVSSIAVYDHGDGVKFEVARGKRYDAGMEMPRRIIDNDAGAGSSGSGGGGSGGSGSGPCDCPPQPTSYTGTGTCNPDGTYTITITANY